MNQKHPFPNTSFVLRQRPQAWARVQGSERYPDLQGIVRFYQTPRGVVVCAEILGLPEEEEPCGWPIFAFHIHEGGECSGTGEDPYANVRMHYNPSGCPHPFHAGDMPPLFGSDGYAFSAFLTNRFTVEEIVGKTVVIHNQPDDFKTQPSGDAGQKIACGVIRR